MVIRFFASNPIFYFKQVVPIAIGTMSEVRCTGHLSFLARIILNYHFTGIIAYLHVIQSIKLEMKFQKFLTGFIFILRNEKS